MLFKRFQRRRRLKFHDFIHLHSPGAKAGYKILIVTKNVLLQSYIVSFSHKSLIHFEKITFPNTNIRGRKLDLAEKKVNGQPTIVV